MQVISFDSCVHHIFSCVQNYYDIKFKRQRYQWIIVKQNL